MQKKKKLLKEIKELLNQYGKEIELDVYVLEYLSLEELENIKKTLIEKQKNAIENNRDWLYGLVK